MYDFSYLGVLCLRRRWGRRQQLASEAGARAATTISANVSEYHLALAKC